MQVKHHSVPWFGASEELQASLALASVTAAVQESTGVPVPAQVQPVTFSTFVTPLPVPQPLPKDAPTPEDTLPYVTEEDVIPCQSSQKGSASVDLELILDEEDPAELQHKLLPPTPSNDDVSWASKFSPSDLQQWDYAVSHHSDIITRYPKGTDSSASFSTALVKEDLPPEESDDVPPTKKSRPAKVPKLKVWPKKDSSSILYHPPKPDDDDDAPSSMV